MTWCACGGVRALAAFVRRGSEPSQRALLKAIAQAPAGVEHPASLEFLSPLRLPTSTGNRAKEVLEQEDLIRQDDEGRWTLVDRVTASCLRSLP